MLEGFLGGGVSAAKKILSFAKKIDRSILTLIPLCVSASLRLCVESFIEYVAVFIEVQY